METQLEMSREYNKHLAGEPPFCARGTDNAGNCPAPTRTGEREPTLQLPRLADTRPNHRTQLL
jgi:hypothetical protein